MRDIALRLDLSVATISLSLNGNPRIPAATRERVCRAAEEMGYRPDPAVAALSKRRGGAAVERSVSVAFLAAGEVCEDLKRNSARPLLQRVHDALRQSFRRDGFGFETLPCPESPEDGKHFRKTARARNVAGLLLAHPFHLPDRLHLSEELPAIALLARHRDAAGRPLVTSNFRQSLIETMDRLRQRGYRKPGLSLVNRTLMYESPRQEPAERGSWRYLSVFESFGTAAFPGTGPLPVHLCEDFDESEFLRWVEVHKPDVIISTSDWEIPSILQSMRSRIDYCGLDIKDPTSDAIAGLDLQREAIAAVATDFLGKRLFAADDPLAHAGVTLEVPAKWIEGESLRPAPRQ